MRDPWSNKSAPPNPAEAPRLQVRRPGRRVGEPSRSGKVRITMTTVRDHGHHSRSFASLRLGVFALFRRAAEVEGRTRDGVASGPLTLGSRLSARETRSPNLPAAGNADWGRICNSGALGSACLSRDVGWYHVYGENCAELRCRAERFLPSVV